MDVWKCHHVFVDNVESWLDYCAVSGARILKQVIHILRVYSVVSIRRRRGGGGCHVMSCVDSETPTLTYGILHKIFFHSGVYLS